MLYLAVNMIVLNYNFIIMKKLILLIVLFFAGLYLNAQEDNCAQLSKNWNSKKKVITSIENSDFNISEILKPNGKSWMTSAHFYSCDNQFGYLIIKCDKKIFVHQNVPISLWRSLQGAKSVGGYYNFYIKDYYKLAKKASGTNTFDKKDYFTLVLLTI